MTHGAVRFLIRTLEAVLLVLLIGAAVLAWRLSQGPLALNAVAPYIAEAFSDMAPGYRFRIESAEFKWGGFSRRPELTVRDVRVLNETGAVIAGLPSMVVRLSVPALLRGVAAPEHVRLSNPIIRFVHRADGSLGMGVEGVPTTATVPATGPLDPASSTAVAASLVAALTRPAGGDNPAGYLNRIAIDGTTLVLVDEVSGQRWLVPDATLNFRRAGGDVEVDATLPVIEEGRRSNFTAKGRYSAATGNLKVDLNVDGFRPARAAGLAPQLEPFAMIDLRLSGTAAASLTLAANGARLSSLQFDVKGQDGQLHLPAPVAQDYAVKSVALKGSAGGDLDSISIEQFRLELDRGREAAPVITLAGEGKSLNTTPVVDLDVGMAELSLPAVKQFWPVGVKANTRDWIMRNLNDGGLSDTRLKLRLAGPSIKDIEATEARLSSQLHGVAVQYMKGMPKVEGTDGRLTISAGEVAIDITAGRVPDAVSGKGLRVPSGKVRLYGLGSNSERANIKLKILGGFGDVMRLIDHEPLGYASGMGLDANRAVGESDVDLTLDFPLVNDLKLSELKLGVAAKVEGVGIPDVAFGLPLSDGRLAVKLDRDGMDVGGTAALGGINTAVQWRENFNGGAFRSRYVLDPVVDNTQRPLVGLSVMPFIPPYIDGAVPAHVIYTVKRDDTRSLEAEIDLSLPAMAIPELGWRKAPGEEARATVTATFLKDHLDAVPSFHVTSGNDLDVSGALKFGADGKMELLSINPSVVGETRLSGKVSTDDAGVYTIDVAGPGFNSTYFWKELSRDDTRGKAPVENGEKQPSTPLTVRASFDRMWLTKDGDFRDVRLNFVRDTAGIQEIDFTSKVDGGLPFVFKLAPENGKRAFKGSSAAGGEVVRAIGLFGDIVGGNLEIGGEFAADGTIKGQAEIKQFKVVQAPLLARLLSVATLTGIVDELRGGGISFKTLRAPFSYGNSTITIKDGEMYGNSLGLTAEGTYNFSSSMMHFDGTLIPAYAINSALNSIPLLGSVLSGGDKGGGIFAATYSYYGEVATAQPSVNPLAALAPGFLRHIFDIFKPSAPQEARTPPAKGAEKVLEKVDEAPKAKD